MCAGFVPSVVPLLLLCVWLMCVFVVAMILVSHVLPFVHIISQISFSLSLELSLSFICSYFLLFFLLFSNFLPLRFFLSHSLSPVLFLLIIYFCFYLRNIFL